MAELGLVGVNPLLLCFFNRFLVREEGKGKEKEKDGHEREHPSGASRTPSTGDPACNLGLSRDLESNQQPLGAWDDAQPAEPQRPERP